MKKSFTILVADPNSHVRNFLIRELKTSGYGVIEAENYDEIFLRIRSDARLRLIIFDLDIPYEKGLIALKRINSLIPPIPTIIYSYLTEFFDHPEVKKAVAFVEKDENPELLFDAVDSAYKKLLNNTPIMT